MPTYEYECEKCGHQFEQFQSITAPPRKRCPKCRGKVRRMIGTGAGIIFKGSGFYATDYRSPSYTEKAKTEKASETSGSGSGTGGSSGKDASTATKKETGGKAAAGASKS